MDSGIGWGGSCFPKDVDALIAWTKENNEKTRIIESTKEVNKQQPLKLVTILKKHIPKLQGKTIGILGLAFKPDTDDIRESRVIPIIDQLLEEGANIKAYDPEAMENFKKQYPNINYCSSASDVLNSDAILITTKWDEFTKLNYKGKIVIDGRRLEKAKKQLKYMRGYAGNMKGLIPAAGMGTRLKPLTLAIPKELLMIGEKAVIEHVIDAMKLAGITEITIVVGWKKHAILDYLGSGSRLDVNINYVVQDEQNGLAKAVATGERILDNDDFAVILGDNFFYPKTFLKDLISFHHEHNADATLGVTEVDDVTRHGIIKAKGNKVIDLIEKPKVDIAPSNLGLMGVYIFKSSIFDMIRKTKPGYNNEYQLTDSIKLLVMNGGNVFFDKINGEHIDVGTLQDLKKANIRFSQL